MSLHALFTFYDNNGSILASGDLKVDAAMSGVRRPFVAVAEWQRVCDQVRILYELHPTACRVTLDVATA